MGTNLLLEHFCSDDYILAGSNLFRPDHFVGEKCYSEKGLKLLVGRKQSKHVSA